MIDLKKIIIMEDEEVLKMYPLFDFCSVYKRNYCTLVNFEIFQIKIRISYFVDGVEKILEQAEDQLFSIQYNEWMNNSYFELEAGKYYSSQEIANEYLENNCKNLGYTKIIKEEAILLAKENLRLQKETRQILNKAN
jgi:hypothetical protein